MDRIPTPTTAKKQPNFSPGSWTSISSTSSTGRTSALYGKEHGALFISVLILSEHLEFCAKKVLNWIAKNLGTWVRTNVMFQDRPMWGAHEIPELQRRLTKREVERAIELAKRGWINEVYNVDVT